MKATIRLFKGLVVKSKGKTKKVEKLLMKTIPLGFVYAPEVMGNYTIKDLDAMVPMIAEEMGLTGEQMNASFHKSWNKVKTASTEQLVLEQIMHYITTYGFESLGCYSEDTVYIPFEELNVPEMKGGLKLHVVSGYTRDEIEAKLLNLMESGVALGRDSIADAVDIVKTYDVKKYIVEASKNKEFRTALYDHFKMVPREPIEFLRFAITKATGRTLLIKDRATIATIKEADKDVSVLFNRYKTAYGLSGLASIFYRFKPIFLAFKTHNELAPVINKIRKLAVHYHKPMPEDFLNSITGKIRNGEPVSTKMLKAKLSTANIFRKIRLAYSLKSRARGSEAIMYRNRNGKAFATTTPLLDEGKAKRVFNIVYKSIVEDIAEHVKDKVICIPPGINYALPATEKMFTGDFPTGSYVTVPKDMVFGVHWKNLPRKRVDLDLSLVNASGKIGWDSSYRSADRDILFSGDITDAPRGATELFYIARQSKAAHMLYVNHFNRYETDEEVPFKIVVGQDQASNMKSNRMLDPNNVLSIAKTSLDQKQVLLGLVVTTTKECRFYYVQSALGSGITSSNNEYSMNALKYMFDYYDNTISLNKILEAAGAMLISDPDPELGGCDIDLSPEAISKDSIIGLVTGR